MKIKKLLRRIRQLPPLILAFVSRRRTDPLPPPLQLGLELDQLSSTGLRLREAFSRAPCRVLVPTERAQPRPARTGVLAGDWAPARVALARPTRSDQLDFLIVP